MFDSKQIQETSDYNEELLLKFFVTKVPKYAENTLQVCHHSVLFFSEFLGIKKSNEKQIFKREIKYISFPKVFSVLNTNLATVLLPRQVFKISQRQTA